MNKPVRREGFQNEPQEVETRPRAPALPAERWPLVIKLEHSKLYDPSLPDPITELKLRQPTGGDINACGSPVVMGDGGLRFVIDDKRMHMMIGRLAGILTPILDGLDPRDWQTIAWRLYRFFLPGPAAWED